MRKILFVDDDQRVLDGLRRAMRAWDSGWSATFVNSGEEALQLLERQRQDIVVSDMKMPGMKGDEFLQRVQDAYPAALRILLSGEVDQSLEGRFLNVAHQVVSKPCSPKELFEAIARADELRQRASFSEERRRVAAVGLSSELVESVKQTCSQLSPEGQFDLSVAASVISSDAALLRRMRECYARLDPDEPELSIEEVLQRCGSEVTSAVFITHRIEIQWGPHACPEFSWVQHWNGCLSVASASVEEVKQVGKSQESVLDAFAAGLLHSLGRLLVAVGRPEEYQRVLLQVQSKEQRLDMVEHEAFGVPLERVAYWALKDSGLNERIREAVGAQVQPSLYAEKDDCLVETLHVVRTLYYSKRENVRDSEAFLDVRYVDRGRLAHRLVEWSENANSSDMTPRAAQQPSILLVDDDDCLRAGLRRILRKEKWQVVESSGGWAALEMLRNRQIDLVLADVKMPKMNGYQFLQLLKEDPDYAHIPVLMLSGLSDIDNVVMCLEAGAEDFLQKPVDKTLLLTRVRGALEKKRLHERDRQHLEELRAEKQRVEELLRVLFPQPVVEELKKEKSVKPRRHEAVSILFADIVGFTSYCRDHSPEVVFQNLQEMMDTFERIAARHDLQKIKTLGDAFLCAGGLWSPKPDPVAASIDAGLEMVRVAPSLPAGWQVRVGIHIGPVISGVVGCRQYLFDVWGDTVNVAARVQQAGTPGTVTVTDDVYSASRQKFKSTGCHRISLKGRGEMILHVIASANRTADAYAS